MKRFAILILMALVLLQSGCSDGDWRTASRQPAGIAPDPALNREAVVQVYAARAWGWRGWVVGQVPAFDVRLPFSAIGSGYSR